MTIIPAEPVAFPSYLIICKISIYFWLLRSSDFILKYNRPNY